MLGSIVFQRHHLLIKVASERRLDCNGPLRTIERVGRAKNLGNSRAALRGSNDRLDRYRERDESCTDEMFKHSLTQSTRFVGMRIWMGQLR